MPGLFSCACQLEVVDSRGGELHDADLKLFCKCLSALSEHTTPSLKFHLLNYVNIVMAKSVRSHDAKVSLIDSARSQYPANFFIEIYP